VRSKIAQVQAPQTPATPAGTTTNTSTTPNVQVLRTVLMPTVRSGTTTFSDGTQLMWSDQYQSMVLIPTQGPVQIINKTLDASQYGALMRTDMKVERDMTTDESDQFDRYFGPIKQRGASSKRVATLVSVPVEVWKHITASVNDLVSSVKDLPATAENINLKTKIAFTQSLLETAENYGKAFANQRTAKGAVEIPADAPQKILQLIDITLQMVDNPNAALSDIKRNLGFLRSDVSQLMKSNALAPASTPPKYNEAPKPAPKKTSMKVTCDACGGKGYTSRMGSTDKECTACKGTGKVNKSMVDTMADPMVSKTSNRKVDKMANMSKVAVDTATEKYWTEYFHEYGEMWVRDIPRRLRLAMRKANKDAQSGTVAPLSHWRGEDGSLVIEAAHVVRSGDHIKRSLVKASFSNDGKLTSLQVFPVTGGYQSKSAQQNGGGKIPTWYFINNQGWRIMLQAADEQSAWRELVQELRDNDEWEQSRKYSRLPDNQAVALAQKEWRFNQEDYDYVNGKGSK